MRPDARHLTRITDPRTCSRACVIFRIVEAPLLFVAIAGTQLGVMLREEWLYFVAFCAAVLFTNVGPSARSAVLRGVWCLCALPFSAALMRSAYPTSELHEYLVSHESEARRELKETRKRSFRGIDAYFEGTVAEQPRHIAHGMLRLVIDAQVEDGPRGKILLTESDAPWTDAFSVTVGDRVEGRALLMSTLRTEEIFSFDAVLARHQIAATGNVLELSRVLAKGERTWLERFATPVLLNFESSDSVSVLLAGMLGMEDLLSRELKALFKRTGTTHLLVISGFHIALIFGLMCRLVKSVLGRSEDLILLLPLPIIAPMIGIVGSSLFVWLIGGMVTTVRALFAVGIIAGGVIFGRSTSAGRNIAFAATFLLFIWPGAFLEPSYQLTFFALLGLAFGRLLARRLHDYFYPETALSSQLRTEHFLFSHSLFKLIVEPLALSFGAAFATTPVTLCWFHTFVPGAPLINLIAIPLFSFSCVVLGGPALLILVCSLPGAEWIFAGALFFVDLFLKVLTGLDSIFQLLRLGIIELSSEQSQLLATLFTMVFLLLWLALLWPNNSNTTSKFSHPNA